MIKQKQGWDSMMALGDAQNKTLVDLFECDTNRLDKYVINVGGLRADFSKQLIDDLVIDTLLNLARASDLEDWRQQLFCGANINTSEDRAVLHMALRGIGGDDSIKKYVTQMRARMTAYANEIRSAGQFESIVHIGIGGSDLGPRLVADAFAAQNEAALDLRFAENVDGASINDALRGLNPATTLIIVVSKSFETQETKMNGSAARDWLSTALGDKAGDNMIAVTANRQGAVEFGIRPEAIFDFWEWVGGRYSVWSAVDLSLKSHSRHNNVTATSQISIGIGSVDEKCGKLDGRGIF